MSTSLEAIPVEEVYLLAAWRTDAIQCDSDDCTRPAWWSLRCEGCAAVLLHCDPCKRLSAIEIPHMIEVHEQYPVCQGCGHFFPVPLPHLPL